MNYLRMTYIFFHLQGGGGDTYGVDLFSVGKPQKNRAHGTCKGEFQVSFLFDRMSRKRGR